MPEIDARFEADAWTDDWCDLANLLGIPYDDLLEVDCLNSREMRKRVRDWADDHGYQPVRDAIAELSVS